MCLTGRKIIGLQLPAGISPGADRLGFQGLHAVSGGHLAGNHVFQISLKWQIIYQIKTLLRRPDLQFSLIYRNPAVSFHCFHSDACPVSLRRPYPHTGIQLRQRLSIQEKRVFLSCKGKGIATVYRLPVFPVIYGKILAGSRGKPDLLMKLSFIACGFQQHPNPAAVLQRLSLRYCLRLFFSFLFLLPGLRYCLWLRWIPLFSCLILFPEKKRSQYENSHCQKVQFCPEDLPLPSALLITPVTHPSISKISSLQGTVFSCTILFI